MRRALQLAAGRLVGAPPLHHGAPTAARHFADKVAEAGASADKPADPAPADGEGDDNGGAEAAEEARLTQAIAAAKRRGKKLPRFAVGSYREFMGEEAETWPNFEPGQPLYSVRNLVTPPGQHMGTGPFAQRLDEVARQAAQERAARESARKQPQDVQKGEAAPAALDAPYPGASRVLRWATHVVLSAGYDQKHPMSNKVEVKVRLRDLAREVGLSPAGVAWIAAVCGPRYDAKTDTLRLVSRRYQTREDNRRDCLRIINELVDEGAREGGGLDAKAPGAHSVLQRQAREKAAAKAPA